MLKMWVNVVEKLRKLPLRGWYARACVVDMLYRMHDVHMWTNNGVKHQWSYDAPRGCTVIAKSPEKTPLLSTLVMYVFPEPGVTLSVQEPEAIKSNQTLQDVTYTDPTWLETNVMFYSKLICYIRMNFYNALLICQSVQASSSHSTFSEEESSSNTS